MFLTRGGDLLHSEVHVFCNESSGEVWAPSKHESLAQCWFNIGSLPTTLTHHWANTGAAPTVCCNWTIHVYHQRVSHGQITHTQATLCPANTKVTVKVQVFIVWYQVWRPIMGLDILPPGHWTCSFMYHFNSPGSIQSCSHIGALNLSYTLPFLSYQVLIFTWVKWSIWGWSVLPKDTPS